jgi:hypothetical protein
VRLLRAAARAPLPWKNGGGVTYEAAVEPPGAGFADFGWRLSTAVVASDGPFSRFEGVDRTLVLLEGAGLTLDIDGRRVALTPEQPLIEFPGEAAVTATLSAGPVLDLNLMVRRGAWLGALEPRRLSAGATLAATEVVLLFALESVTLATARGQVSLAPRDALRLEAGERAVVASPAKLLVAELSRTG